MHNLLQTTGSDEPIRSKWGLLKIAKGSSTLVLRALSFLRCDLYQALTFVEHPGVSAKTNFISRGIVMGNTEENPEMVREHLDGDV